MSRERGILLASFLTTDDDSKVQDEVEFIVNNIQITNNYIFLLQDEKDPLRKIITYNAVVKKGDPFNPRLYTMRVHRKKQTNTLYTINALNKAVSEQHDGQTGKHLKLDWSAYENCILLTSGKQLKVVPLQVTKIFKIEDPEET
tara:strand:+ start:931 stop:1362 length:432 start_codon:yes stop_codon:yes gene_type:complete